MKNDLNGDNDETDDSTVFKQSEANDEPTNYFRRKLSLFALLLLQDKTDERKSNEIGPLLAF